MQILILTCSQHGWSAFSCSFAVRTVHFSSSCLVGGRSQSMADKKKRTKRRGGHDATMEETVDDGGAAAATPKKGPQVRKRLTGKEPSVMGGGEPRAAPQKKELSPEVEAAIQRFVEMCTSIGVDGLRKMFREQMANLCPPATRCVAFEANTTRNRYGDIVCIEETRVKLTDDVPPSTDYIHANWVKFATHDRTFIATQGPLESTIEDFWRMVFQEKCPIIVNLTKTVEEGKIKCSQYWPEHVGAYQTVGRYFINNKKVEDDDKFTLSTIEVLPEGCSDSHIVKLIHMANWPDKGVPMSGLSVLRLLKVVTTADKLATGPVVVHCSAGVGRTGTVILIDVILQRIFKTGGNVDLIELFKELRNQRAACIQKEGQFVCVVSSILEYIRARNPRMNRKEIDKFTADFKNSNLQSN